MKDGLYAHGVAPFTRTHASAITCSTEDAGRTAAAYLCPLMVLARARDHCHSINTPHLSGSPHPSRDDLHTLACPPDSPSRSTSTALPLSSPSQTNNPAHPLLPARTPNSTLVNQNTHMNNLRSHFHTVHHPAKVTLPLHTCCATLPSSPCCLTRAPPLHVHSTIRSAMLSGSTCIPPAAHSPSNRRMWSSSVSWCLIFLSCPPSTQYSAGLIFML